MLARISAAALALALYVAGCVFAAHAQNAPPATGFTGNPFVALGNHLIVGGNPPSGSTGCGTGFVISGSDTVGSIVLGTGTSQPCTLTFAQAFRTLPVCQVTAETAIANFGYNATFQALNITALTDSVKLDWDCWGTPGVR